MAPFHIVAGNAKRKWDPYSSRTAEMLKPIQAASGESSHTTEHCSQVHWSIECAEDVSSRASPEILGAVDLLSLKAGAVHYSRTEDIAVSVPSWECPASCSHRFALGLQLSDGSATSDNMRDRGASESAEAGINSNTSCNKGDSQNSHVGSLQQQALPAPHRLTSKQRKPARVSNYAVKVAKGSSQQAAQKTKGGSRDPACIKEWAALTTWLRMNLHQARTAKRQVCFVGWRSKQHGRWVFDLNPKLPWSEVSRETKQRLRSLPKEAEKAFVRKYPARDPNAWQDKAIKYKPGCDIDAYDIAMGPLVSDLHNLYLKHEVHSWKSVQSRL